MRLLTAWHSRTELRKIFDKHKLRNDDVGVLFLDGGKALIATDDNVETILLEEKGFARLIMAESTLTRIKLEQRYTLMGNTQVFGL